MNANRKLGPTELQQISLELESAVPREILAWALNVYSPRITLACSFGGPTGMVLLDMLMHLEPTTTVYYLDTGFLFAETYALVAEVSRRYGITPNAVRPELSAEQQAAQYGDALWQRDPDHCCELRKVLPQREALRGFDAWLTGLRRDQANSRSAVPVVQWDSKFGLAKINPLARWTESEIWRYIRDHDVPYNRLHDRGYASIGCTHCTRPIAANEDPRAGRWSGFTKVECGLHTR